MVGVRWRLTPPGLVRRLTRIWAWQGRPSEVRCRCQRLMPSSAVRRPRDACATAGTGGRLRKRARARRKGSAQGHSSGVRSVGTPERLTSRPGTEKNRVRTVRATVKCSAGVSLAQHGGPADEVMGERGAEEPGGVGEEVSRGHVLESRTFFEVPDGEFDPGMFTVEGVDVDGVALEVGQEGEVAPLRATRWPGDRSGGCVAR